MSNSMPSVLFYAGDYLVGVIGMTWDEQGRYMYLLCLQQQKGHIDIDTIMPDCPDAVRDKFVTDENGLYYNERMEYELQKRYKYVESRRANRLKAVDKNTSTVDKSTYEKHMSHHMKNICQTYEKHMDNDNDNDNDNDIKTSDLLKEASKGTTYDKLDKTLKNRVNRKTYEKIQQTIS